MATPIEASRPPTPSSSSPDTPQRPLPALPPSSLPLATRRPTKNSRAMANAGIKTHLEPVMEGDGRLMRDVHSPPPGDVRRLRGKVSRPELSKQRSQYFEEAFRSKHSGDSRDDAITVSSMILAEVRTNVFVADEYSFITDLAQHLSIRYNHPANNVAISLQHGACLHFGGTFDPAYTVAVHAPPSLLQPATNRRNVALLQSHFEEAIRVGPSRGFVRFVPVPEECSGWRSNTVAGEREREKEREKERGNERDKERDGMRDGEESPTQKKRAMRSLSIKRPTESKTHTPRKSPPETSTSTSTSQDIGHKVGVDGEVLGRGLRKKKSFIHSLFVKGPRGDVG